MNTDPDPSGGDVLLTPPSAEETRTLARGVVSAVGGLEALSSLQRLLVHAVFSAMTGHNIDLDTVPPITAQDFAALSARRNAMFRTRIVQRMLRVAFSMRLLADATVARIQEFATPSMSKTT